MIGGTTMFDTPEHERDTTGDESRVAWIVSLVSIAALALGFIAATWLFSEPDATELTRYVEFQKMDVQNISGLAVLSFALKMERDDFALAVSRRGAMEARFKQAIAQYDLASLYSRRGKEALAQLLREIANDELGGDVVDGVYFGNFKVYTRERST